MGHPFHHVLLAYMAIAVAGDHRMLTNPEASQQSDSVCARSCHNADSMWTRHSDRDDYRSIFHPHYIPRVTYRYFYEGEVVTRAEVVEDADSRLGVRAFVNLVANTPCDMKIKIEDMEITNVRPEDSKDLRASFEAHDLHFSFKDGRIDELCPHVDEDPRALNFKRAILSSLQTTLSSSAFQPGVSHTTQVLETDASGQCRTKYVVESPRADGFFTVNKTKEECMSTGAFPYIPHTHYTSDFDRSHHSPRTPDDIGDPVYRHDHHCQMILEGGIWQSVECHEFVGIRSVSTSGSAGQLATVRLHSSLQLHETLRDEQEDPEFLFKTEEGDRKRKGLQMSLEPHRDLTEMSVTPEEVGMTLSRLHLATTDNSQMEDRSHMFSHLVHQLSHMKGKENFDRLLVEYKDKDHYKDYLNDALATCETKECFEATTSFAQSSYSFKNDLWLAGLHFAKNPAVESIQSVMNLVKSGRYSEEALMAASSLIFRLCREQDKCNLNVKGEFRQQPHRSFLDYVEGGLGTDCGYGDPSQYTRIVLLLKALGNSGLDLGNSKLRKCYMNKMHSRDVRVAALMSFRRRYDCNEDKDELWHLLEDMHEDVAVRIESYKVLQTCADNYGDFYGRIKGLLLAEEVNQVGSYIWTHVRNLARSSSVEREPVSVLANHHYLLNKFDTNSFKQSKNYHSSFHSDTMDFGGSIDSDAVFTPDSFLPYSARLNLTVNVLHNSFNPIEIGGNLHGFEKHFRRLFEKGSYFSNDRIFEFLDNLKRQKRSTEDSKIDELQHVYDEARTRMEVPDDEESDPTFFVRVFGNEVFHFDARNPSQVFRKIESFLRLLRRPVSLQLLDQEYVAPTILGFPLRLRLNTTSSHTMHVEEKKDSSEFQMNFVPSTSLTFDESLGVEAYVASSAIRRTVTTVSRADIGFSVSFKSYRDFAVRLLVPNNEILKLSTTSKLLFYDSSSSSWNNYASRSVGNEILSCSGQYTRQPLGVEFCASSMAGPNGFQSLEPFKAQLVLSKTDTFDRYLFSFNISRNMLMIDFDTPDSSINRRLGLEYNFDDNSNLEAIVHTQDKSYVLLGQVVDDPRSISMNLGYREDDVAQIDFTFETSFTRGHSDESTAFKIDLMYFGHNYGIKTFSTYSSRHSPTRFSSNGTLYGFSDEPYEMKVHFNSDLQQYLVGFGADDTKEIATKNDFVLEAMVEFSAHGITERTQVNVSGGKRFEEGFDKWRGSLHVENTLLTDIKLKGDYELLLNPEEVDIRCSLMMNENEIMTHGRWYQLRQDDSYDLQVLLETKCDQLELDYKSQAIIKVSPRAAHLEAELNLKDSLVVKGSTMFTFQDSPLLLQAGAHLQYQDAVLRFLHELDFSQDDRFDVVLEATVGEFSTGTVARASWPEGQDWDMELNAHVRFDNTREASFVSTRKLSAAMEKYSAQTLIKYGTNFMYWTEDGFWSSEKKSFSIGCEESFFVSAILQTSPTLDAQVRVDFAGEQEPTFQVGLKETQPSQAFELFFRPGTENLPVVEGSVILTSDSFRGSLAVGTDSRADVEGSFTQGDGDNSLDSQASLHIQTPDGNSYSSQVKLQHTYDGKTRDIRLLGLYEDQEITTVLKILNHDGWFSYDSFGISLEVQTPFEVFRSSHFAFETHGHSSQPSVMEVGVDDYKLRGDIRFTDFSDLELTFSYEDGGNSDSRLRLHYKCDDETFRTRASLKITPDYTLPWAFELYGYNGYGGYLENLLKFQLDLSSPIYQNPLKIGGQYKASSSSFDILWVFDAGEEVKLHLFGNQQSSWSGDEVSAKFNLELPSIKPITFDVKSLYTGSTFTLESELNTLWDILDSVNLKANFSSSDPEKFIWNLDLHSPDYEFRNEINIDLKNNPGLESIWNIFLSKAHVNLSFREHNEEHHTYQLTHDFVTEEDNIVNTLTLLWQNKELLHIDSNTQVNDITNWSVGAEFTLPALSSNTYNAEIEVHGNYSSLAGTFAFTPLWEEQFTQSFTFDREDDKVSVEVSSILGKEQILRLHGDLDMNEAPDRLEFSIDLDAPALPHVSLSWAHDLVYSQYIMARLMCGTYSSLFTHQLTFGGSGEFQAYKTELELPVSNDAKFEMGVEGYSNYTGSLEMHLDHNSLVFSTNHEKGLIGEIEIKGIEYGMGAILQHIKQENGGHSFVFRGLENQLPMLTATLNITSLFPKLDVSLSSTYKEKILDLELFCDLSRLEDDNVTTILSISSDFEILKDARFMANGTFGYMDGGVLAIALEADAHLETYGMKNEGKISLNMQANTNLLEMSFDVKALFTLESFGIYEEGLESSIKFALWDNFKSSFQLLVSKFYNPSFAIKVNFGPFNLDTELTLFGTTYQVSAAKGRSNSFQVEVSMANEGSAPTKATLEVKWLFRQVIQINLNGQSDFGHVNKIVGKIKGNPARQIAGSFELLSRDKESFAAIAKYVTKKSDHSSSTVIIKVKNRIISQFQGAMKLDYALEDQRFESDLTVSTNRIRKIIENSIRYEFYELLSIKTNTPWFYLTFSLDLNENPSLTFNFKTTPFELSFHWRVEQDYQLLEAKSEVVIEKGGIQEKQYDFKMSYDITTDDKTFEFNVGRNDQTFIDARASVHFETGNYEIKSEIKMPDYIKLGTTVQYSTSLTSLNLVVYDLDSKNNYGTANYVMSSTTFTFSANLLDDYNMSVTAEYDFGGSKYLFEGKGSMQIRDIEMTAIVNGSGNDTRGNLDIDIYIETSGVAFETLKLTIDYNFGSHHTKIISYKLEGSTGTSKGNLAIENHWVLLKGKYKYNKNNIVISGEMKTNVNDNTTFVVELKRLIDSNTYQGTAMMKSGRIQCGITFTHRNSPSWAMADTTVKLSFMGAMPGLRLCYDFEEKYAAGLFLIQHDKSLGAEMGYVEMQDDHKVDLRIDLTYLDEGKYHISSQFHTRELINPFSIKFSRSEHPMPFSISSEFENSFRVGEFTFVSSSPDNLFHNSSSSFAYNAQDRSLTVKGHHESYTMEGTLHLTGKENPWTAMSAVFKTNIEGYENLDAYWKVGENDQTIYVDVVMDMREKKKLQLLASLNYQPQGMKRPWRRTIFKASFVSPFTLSHEVNVDYHIDNFNSYVSYQCGLDKFEVDVNTKSGSKWGFIKISGNSPIPYISDFNFEGRYNFKKSYKIEANCNVESTVFKIAFDFMEDFTKLELKSEFTSPLFTNFQGNLMWEILDGRKGFEFKVMNGPHKYMMKMEFTHAEDFGDGRFSLGLVSPFQMLMSLSFDGKYSIVKPSGIDLSLNIGINKEIISVIVKTLYKRKIVTVLLEGKTSFYDNASGKISGEISLSGKSDLYDTKWIVTWMEQQSIQLTSNLNKAQFSVFVEYENEHIFSINIERESREFEVGVKWQERELFHAKGNWQSTRNEKLFTIDMTNHKAEPMRLTVQYSHQKGHAARAELEIADIKYTLDTEVDIRKRKSLLKMRYVSSDDPYNEIIANFQYDIAAFMKGQMNSMEDLLSFGFTWGDRLAFILRGMRNGDRTKIESEISTPFRELPVLRFGLDGELMVKEVFLDVTGTTYVEWDKKILLTGSLQTKDGKFNLQGTLETPLQSLQKLSITLFISPDNIEAIVLQNGNEWKLLMKYNFNGPPFEIMVSVATPLPNLEEMNIASKMDFEDSFLSINLFMQVNGKELINFDAKTEYWRLHTTLKTPWKPLSNVQFSASLSTESEDVTALMRLQLQEDVYESVSVLRSVDDFVSIKLSLNENNIETIKAILSLTHKENLANLEFLVESEYNSINGITFKIAMDHMKWFERANGYVNIEIDFVLPVKNFELSINGSIENFGLQAFVSFNLEWDESYIGSSIGYNYAFPAMIQFSVRFPLGHQPFNFSFKASLPESYILLILNNNKFHAMWKEVGPSKVKALLILKFEGLPVVEMKGTIHMINAFTYHPEVKIILQLKVHMFDDSRTPDVDCIVNCHYSYSNNELKVEGEFKFFQQMHYNVNAFAATPTTLTDTFVWELELSKEDATLLKLNYNHSISNPNTEISLKAETGTVEAAFLLYSNNKNNLSITFNSHDTSEVYSFVITWDIEKILASMSLDVKSAYLSKGDIYVRINLTNSDIIFVQAEAEYGQGHKLALNIPFNHYDWTLNYTLSVQSEYFGNASSEFSLKWLSSLSISLDLNLHKENHNAFFNLSRKDTSFEFYIKLKSPALSRDYFDIKVTLYTTDEWSNGHLHGNAQLWENIVYFSGNYTWQDGELNVSFGAEHEEEEILRTTIVGAFDHHWNVTLDLASSNPHYNDSYFHLGITPSWPFSASLRAGTPQNSRQIYIYLSDQFGEAWIKNDQEQHQPLEEAYYDFQGSKIAITTKSSHLRFSAFMTLTYDDNLRCLLHLTTPFTDERLIEISFYAPLQMPLWYDYAYGFQISTMGYSFGLHGAVQLTQMPYMINVQVSGENDYTVLHLEYEDGERSAAIATLLLPGGKVGFKFVKDFKSWIDCDLTAALYVPVKGYDFLSFRYIFRPEWIAIEARIINIGFGIELIGKPVNSITKIVEIHVKFNEHINVLKTRVQILDFSGEMSDLSFFKVSIKLKGSDILPYFLESKELKINYDENDHASIILEEYSMRVFKIYIGWGETKGIHIAQNYFITRFELKALSNDKEDNLIIEYSNSYEKYGICYYNKVLTGGNKIHISGEVPSTELGLTLSLAIDPTHFENGIILHLNNHDYGYCISYNWNTHLIVQDFYTEVKIMVKDFHPFIRISLHQDPTNIQFYLVCDYIPEKQSPGKPSLMLINIGIDDFTILGAGEIDFHTYFQIRDMNLDLNNHLIIQNSGEFYGKADLRNYSEDKHFYSLEYNWIPVDDMTGNGVSYVVLELPETNALFSATIATDSSQENKAIDMVIIIDVGSLDVPAEIQFNFSRTEKDGEFDLSASLCFQGGSTYEILLRTGEILDRKYVHFIGKDQVMNGTWSIRAGFWEDLPHAYLEYGIGNEKNLPYESRSLRIGLVDPNNLGVFLNHELFGNIKNDFQASLSLENQDSLRISCTFDPAIRYVTSDLGTLMHFLSPMDKIIFPADLNDRLRDLWYKENLIIEKLYLPVELASFSALLEEEIKTMTNRITDACDKLSVIWEENQFFVEVLSSTYHHMFEVAQYLSSQIREGFLRVVNTLILELYYKVNKLVKMFESVTNNIMYILIKEINWIIGHTIRVLGPLFHSAMNCMHNLFTDLQRYIEEMKDKLMDLSGQFFSLEQTNVVWEFIRGDEFFSFLSETRYPQELLGHLYRFLAEGTRDMMESFEKSQIRDFFIHPWNNDFLSIKKMEEWSQQIMGTIIPVLQFVPELRGHAVVDYLNAVTANSFSRLVELWLDMEAERVVFIEAVVDLFTFINNFIDADSFELFLDEEIFAPEKGILLNYVQYLPVPWVSFTQPPEWSSLENIASLRSEEHVRRALALTLQEMEGGWIAVGSSGSWVPPFIATASIIGQQVTTFDQRHFEFLGTCSYLLTRDFHEKSFDVIGNYQSDQGVVSLESVALRTPGKLMRLTVDGRLFVNDNETEIPYDSEGMHMVKRTSAGVHMAYDKTVLVSCWPATRGCSVTVSGKFFGRLAGLLGNFNNEPSDDLQGPGLTDTYSIRHFSSLWAVNDKPCYSANYAIQNRFEDGSADENCDKIFLSKFSPLKECFSSVNPIPYFWRCVNDMSRTTLGYEEEKSVCAAAKGYSLQCFTQGIMVPQLQECKRCVTSSGESVKVGWKEKVEAAATSKNKADIAILLETAKCNTDRDIVGLITALEKGLKKEGKTDVRFSYVPFHKESKPAPTQVEGEVFHTPDAIKDLVKTINYKFRASMEGRLAAIHLASELPWREGASHSVIAISCSPCRPSDPGQFRDFLKDQGITLHLITKARFEVEAPTSKKSKAIAAKVLGFDNRAAYTVKDYVKFNGDENIRAAMTVDEDMCVSGTLESNGSVFNSLKWVPRKTILVTKFMRVVASRVAKDKVVEGKDCQVCQCQVDESGSTDIVCSECSQEGPEMLDDQVGDDRGVEKQTSILERIKQDFEKGFGDVVVSFPPELNRNSSNFDETSESDESDESSEEQELHSHA
ncbi:uncharacterized protein LOC143041518 [Oratosquilla oratoria]|uniref:uncharacterized protein LOC143041518 n=1 Tax=Oratosquilla oratoria TaxID=337810 RepID=UPI003F76707D